LKSDDRYIALDGLRGVAALSVVLFHIGHWLNAPNLASNSGLAVDFFFCLSGFVLPLAYEKRLQTDLSAVGFLKIRLVRLMPLIVLGTLVAAPYVLLRSSVVGTPLSYSELLLATCLGLLNIPLLNASSAIGGPQVFPLNGPQYSLFLEIAVNAIWAALKRFNLACVSVILLLGCLAILPFSGLGGDSTSTFWAGFPRVCASFFLGVAVFNLNQKLKPRAHFAIVFWALSVGMLLLFYYPGELNLSVHIIWLALLSPLLVLAGANTELSGRLRIISSIGGRLSYPVYALHYPIFIWVNGAYQIVTKHQDVAAEAPIIVASVLLGAYVALKVFDEPVRRRVGRLLR
jgi:peptidoglycan/LPS O-acetylase OafA/YrhL